MCPQPTAIGQRFHSRGSDSHALARFNAATRARRHARLVRDMLRLTAWFARTGRTSISDGSGIVAEFEDAFRRSIGTRYAVAVDSGTAALHSAFFAVGVGPGTEVVVPSYTWHSTASPILECGAVPVFCDVDPCSLTIGPREVERCLSPRTRAICVVHTWGNPAEMDELTRLAREHGLFVVEDCSHAHGAHYADRPVGQWGHIGCFSLHASKPVAGGEAGVAVTDDPVLFDRMLLLGQPGRLRRGQAADSFDVGEANLGPKYRPHAFAVHLARSQLKRLPALNERRARLWARIEAELEESSSLTPIATLPKAMRGGFYRYVIRYEAPTGGAPVAEVVKAARGRGIPIEVDPYAADLLHRSALFTSLDRRSLGGGYYDTTRAWTENLTTTSLPVSELLSDQLLSFDQLLPLASERFVSRIARGLVRVADGLASSPR
jgi:perosamine synthetase